MITEKDYWMGRDEKYASECTDTIKRNASDTCKCINKLLAIASTEAGIVRNKMSSGWRPKSVNDATANAGKYSTHITAEGGDVQDLDRALAAWCVINPEKLAECGLWMEDPRWTPTWCHFQRKPPLSGKRIYIPSTKPAIAPALYGQKPIPNMVIT